MSIVTPSGKGRVLIDPDAIRKYLAGVGIEYDNWIPSHPIAPDAPADEILTAYQEEIRTLMARGRYVTADVIDVNPQTPDLDAMLEKFRREHWHDEDEVRFVIHGRGVFSIRPRLGPVVTIEVHAGDLIRVPRGTWHWFNLCADREIRAIRLFQDPAGWTPQYTNSGMDERYQPVCLGSSYLPARQMSAS
ncbi:MAG: cupin domain-containing protein [Acidobacteriia bacterium]|nr:cupin domain-containing protein [Terriglobia bacterium]